MEWLFLLLPIAAISGWLSARAHYKKKNLPSTSALNPEYFKGLNYLLNEQPDKAIDVFIRLLEVNSETVETHLALANLFRRRGETDRAIRIHQNLIARPTLSTEQRNQALIELGLDYMSAGVLDRAEHLFLELLNKPSPSVQVCEQLLKIYQQEKEWQKAIEMAKNIYSQDKSKTHIGSVIAQFYCELSQQQNTPLNEAIKCVKQALSYDKQCVRATLIEATLHIKANNYRKALKCLKSIEHQNHLYIPEALPLLLTCHQNMKSLSEFKRWLQTMLNTHPSMTHVRIMLTRVIQQSSGNQKAQDYLHHQLQKHPSVEGLHTLISLGEPSHPVLVPLIQGITNTLVLKGDRYACPHCGFSGKNMHWLCPGCNQWSTVRPIDIHLSTLNTLSEPSHD